MSPGAKVRSIDAVEAMASSVTVFGDETSAALADLELEIRRAVEWIRHDRKLYWEKEVREGWDRVASARTELERCQVLHKVADHRPSCIEEKKALQRAKQRLDVAQQKVKLVRQWAHAVEKEVNECRAAVGQLAQWLQGELPKAVTTLHRMTAALEHYVRMESGVESLVAEGRGVLARQGPAESPPPAPPGVPPQGPQPGQAEGPAAGQPVEPASSAPPAGGPDCGRIEEPHSP
jgi:hypothetical protein